MKGLCPLPYYNADKVPMAVCCKKLDFIFKDEDLAVEYAQKYLELQE